MSKLSIIFSPPRGKVEFNFLEIAQQDVNDFFSVENKLEILKSNRLIMSWFDDAPVSAGVAVTAIFTDLEVFDLLANLQTFLRKKGYTVSVSLGY